MQSPEAFSDRCRDLFDGGGSFQSVAVLVAARDAEVRADAGAATAARLAAHQQTWSALVNLVARLRMLELEWQGTAPACAAELTATVTAYPLLTAALDNVP